MRCFITCAVTGSGETTHKSPHVPVTPEQIANSAIDAAKAAKALGVKVYTIGVGTHGEAPVPQTDVFGRKRYVPMAVDIDEETLTKVAEKTGGKYFRADSSETLRRIFAEIDRLEKTTIEVKKFQRYRELAHWLIAAGLGLLVAELVLANTLWRKLP